MNITEFLNEQYSDAALYILYRATASYIDGLKNAARKVVYISKKQNLKTPVKVSALGSKVVEGAQYLHGDSGIQGTIVTMAKYYCGTGNLPVLEGIGSFGTRFSPYASAPRYIFAKPADYFDLLFKKEDDINLVSQEFEGSEIEPVFYVPTLPLILVNGSEGIGVGFSSTILPRSVENIIKATRALLDGKKIKEDWLQPSWNGFRGTVEKSEDSWIVKGIATLEKKKLLIDELPMDWDLGSYLKHLDKCKEKGIILRYNDFSEDEHFKFEVFLTDAELNKGEALIWKDLGLVSSIPENLTVFDENNTVRDSYKSVREILDDYFKIKIKYLELRKKSETARLTKEHSDLTEMYNFVQEVIQDKINMKLKKAEVEKILKKKSYTIIDRLLAMPISSITEDKAKELEKKLKDKLKELQTMKKATPQDLWKQDIDALEAELKKTGFLNNNNGKEENVSSKKKTRAKSNNKAS